MNQEKIKDTNLTIDRLENLAKLVVDSWDMEAVIEFAEYQVFQDYQYDIDRAVQDANDLEFTVEDLDQDQSQKIFQMLSLEWNELLALVFLAILTINAIDTMIWRRK